MNPLSDILSQHQKEVNRLTDELYIKILENYLGREPKRKDFKRMNIYYKQNDNNQYIMIDGNYVGYICMVMNYENNSINMSLDFIPETK